MCSSGRGAGNESPLPGGRSRTSAPFPRDCSGRISGASPPPSPPPTARSRGVASKRRMAARKAVRKENFEWQRIFHLFTYIFTYFFSDLGQKKLKSFSRRLKKLFFFCDCFSYYSLQLHVNIFNFFLMNPYCNSKACHKPLNKNK